MVTSVYCTPVFSISYLESIIPSPVAMEPFPSPPDMIVIKHMVSKSIRILTYARTACTLPLCADYKVRCSQSEDLMLRTTLEIFP